MCFPALSPVVLLGSVVVRHLLLHPVLREMEKPPVVLEIALPRQSKPSGVLVEGGIPMPHKEAFVGRI